MCDFKNIYDFSFGGEGVRSAIEEYLFKLYDLFWQPANQLTLKTQILNLCKHGSKPPLKSPILSLVKGERSWCTVTLPLMGTKISSSPYFHAS